MTSFVVDATSFTTKPMTGIPNYALKVSEAILRAGEVGARFFTLGDPALFTLPEDRLHRLSWVERQARCLIAYRFFPPGRRAWFWCPFYSWPLGIERRARVVLTVHDMLYRTALGDRREARFTPREKRFRAKFEDAIRRADRIVAVSGTTADQVAGLFGIDRESIPVAYPGLDRSVFSPVGANRCRQAAEHYGIRDRFVLALSSVSPRRNLETLVRAFASVAPLFPDVDLVIAGSLSYAPEYARKLQNLAAETAPGRVVFPDYIRSEDLPVLYSGAELFVSASFFEGFDMPVAEAMACGTPAAVSDIPVHREVCGESAAYFEPSDAESLSEILEARLGREKTSPLFDPGRFSWEAGARVYIDLIRDRH